MRRYKYQALVTLLPQADGGPSATLPGPACRMVVRARHHETHVSKLFSALVATSEDRPPGGSQLAVTMSVLGDDAGEYLTAGEDFALWRGGDVGRGVVTGRIFV
jgi:hypothetical protein